MRMFWFDERLILIVSVKLAIRFRSSHPVASATLLTAPERSAAQAKVKSGALGCAHDAQSPEKIHNLRFGADNGFNTDRSIRGRGDAFTNQKLTHGD